MKTSRAISPRVSSSLSPPLTKLVIATKNLHKLREFRSLLQPLKELEIYSLSDFTDYQPPPEMGATFEENAQLKATHAAQSLNMWALGDDSGLVVPALEGAPGIFSARYAGEGATDKDNRNKLLYEMRLLEGEARAAFYECFLVLASPTGFTRPVRGICEGMILTEQRGRNGFGYDPLFLKHGYKLSFSEIEERVKNQVSHRGKAFAKMLILLESLLKPLA